MPTLLISLSEVSLSLAKAESHKHPLSRSSHCSQPGCGTWPLRGLPQAAATAGPIMCLHMCPGAPSRSQQQLCSVLSGNNYRPGWASAAHSAPVGSNRHCNRGKLKVPGPSWRGSVSTITSALAQPRGPVTILKGGYCRPQIMQVSTNSVYLHYPKAINTLKCFLKYFIYVYKSNIQRMFKSHFSLFRVHLHFIKLLCLASFAGSSYNH